MAVGLFYWAWPSSYNSPQICVSKAKPIWTVIHHWNYPRYKSMKLFKWYGPEGSLLALEAGTFQEYRRIQLNRRRSDG